MMLWIFYSCDYKSLQCILRFTWYYCCFRPFYHGNGNRFSPQKGGYPEILLQKRSIKMISKLYILKQGGTPCTQRIYNGLRMTSFRLISKDVVCVTHREIVSHTGSVSRLKDEPEDPHTHIYY